MSLAYEKNIISSNLNLEMHSGEIIALVGKNGVGKSTFSRCLCGLHKEIKGTILYDGVRTNYKKRRKIGYIVMQDVNRQLFGDSVKNECFLGNRGVEKNSVENMLKELRLYDHKDMHPQTLSGGQKQRLAVAVAVLSGKTVLIFDEPTSGLDYENMCKVCEMIKELSEKGKIIIIVTHDIELIETVCTRCIELRKEGLSEIKSQS